MGPGRLAALALGALALAMIGWLARSDERDGAPVAPADATTQPALATPRLASAAIADAPASPAAPESSVVPARVEIIEAATPATTKTAEPRSIVVGRVIDERGEPLAGARALLHAWRWWGHGVDAMSVRPPHVAERHTPVGFDATSDPAGHFRFDVPPPDSALVWLSVEAGPMRDSYVVLFGRGSVGPLVTGERDIGTITLATSGAVTGRVVDAAWQPLGGVELDLGGKDTALGRKTWTAADGRFALGHAPRGEQHLTARLEGYLRLAPQVITIEAGRVTDVGDLVLEVGRVLEGTVRDEGGRPLEDARLSSWPNTGGYQASAMSGADGRFVVHLSQDVPYTLGAKLDGFGPWGNDRDHSVLFEPGTRDIEVVLVRLEPTRFRVLDDATGEPLERFGFGIRTGRGSEAPQSTLGSPTRPPSQDRPGGIVEATAREGLDAYVAAADGYLPSHGDVRFDVPGVPAQTIRLALGQGVVGRVVDGSAPVSGASVVLEQWFDVGVGAPPVPAGPHSAPPTTTNSGGAFAFSGVAPGTHRLTVRPATGASLVHVVEVQRGRDLDVGELALLRGATILGEVIVPAGADPAGLGVRLGDFFSGSRATTDAAGRFRFDDVAAGEHHLTAEAIAGLLDAGARASVTVAAGETATVTIDARAHALSSVELTVLINGAPAPGTEVFLMWPEMTFGAGGLGRCDAEGRARGHARGGVDASVTIRHEGAFVEHPTARLALEPLGRFEDTVRFDLGALVVQLPESATLPQKGRATLVLTALGEGAAQRRSVDLDGSRELTFPGIWPGRYTLTLDLIDGDTAPVREVQPDGRTLFHWEPTWTGGGEATVEVGRTSSVALD